MEKTFAAVDLFDKVPQHALGLIEIGDYTIFKRTYSNNIAGSTANHSLGFFTDMEDFIRTRINCDNTRLSQQNASASDVHECVRGTEVYPHIPRKPASELPEYIHHGKAASPASWARQ